MCVGVRVCVVMAGMCKAGRCKNSSYRQVQDVTLGVPAPVSSTPYGDGVHTNVEMNNPTPDRIQFERAVEMDV